MALRVCALLAATIFLTANSDVRAQNLEGTPLVSCPGYEKDHRLVSELPWSVGCLLQAIHDKNKEIIAILSRPTRCIEAAPCDGPLDADSSELLFGLDGSGKTAEGTPSVSSRLAKAESILIVTNLNSAFKNYVTVKIIPKPGKNSARAREAQFFETDFIFGETLSIWVDYEFFHFETDYLADKYGPNDIVDLSGGDTALPLMVWKPKH